MKLQNDEKNEAFMKLIEYMEYAEDILDAQAIARKDGGVCGRAY